MTITHPHRRFRRALVGAALGLAVLAPALAAGAAPTGGLAAARAATASFHDLATAQAAGYSFKVVDVNGIECIADPAGGMGVHYVNLSYLGDPSESATTPEALVYAPQKDGRLQLVAVEYIVLQSDWEAAGNTAPPSLFGQTFELVSSPNRYGLPNFYELHAWVWKHNPAGMFADWNPKVSCPA